MNGELIIPSFPELEFEEKSHIYKLNGEIIPSVSKVMKPLSKALYRDVDEAVLNQAAKRGTAVHNAIENYVLYGIEDIEPAYRGYFDAFKKWWEENNPTVLGTECKVYHKILRYAGTADMLVSINGKWILVDFKTSATVNRMLTGVQLEAYSKAYDSHGIHFDSKAILHLQNSGNFKWHEYQSRDIENWEVFGALMKVHNHIKKYK